MFKLPDKDVKAKFTYLILPAWPDLVSTLLELFTKFKD